MSFPAPQVLLYALLLGTGLGLLFTVLEVVRLVLALRKVVVFLLDVLFCVFSVGASFLLALAVSGGSLRAYQVVCEAIGFLCIYWTVTYTVRRILHRIMRWWQRTAKQPKCSVNAEDENILRKKQGSTRFVKRKCAFLENRSKKIKKNT